MCLHYEHIHPGLFVYGVGVGELIPPGVPEPVGVRDPVGVPDDEGDAVLVAVGDTIIAVK
jgi:hypothetical protein